MAGIKEFSSGAQTQLGGAIGDGIETLDLNQEIEFQAYSRVVLPVDRYVYWQPTATLCVKGSLHWSQEIEQNADETVGVASVTFTTAAEVESFSSAINTIYLGEAENGLRYAFSAQQGFYTQAGLWHYTGRSIYPALYPLLLDRPGMIDPARAVTSNSLALWIALNTYQPLYGFKPNLTLYPADLVEPNLIPPYGAVVIDGTRALSAIPALDGNSSSTQVVSDRVRLVLYGLQSNESIDFLNAIIQYSRDTGNFGLQSMPTVVDVRRPQPELQAIAMQKTIDVTIAYNQARVNTVARKLITSAVPTVLINS